MTLDLSWLTPALAVGGGFAGELVEDLARRHRIAAVVDLREEACDDRELLGQHGVVLLHLPTADVCAVPAAMLTDGVEFVLGHLEAGRRVLVHCQHGIGRSTMLALCVLVELGHAPLAALELAKSRRAVVSPSPAQLEGFTEWLRATRRAIPTFDEMAAIAYRHLKSA